MLKPERIEQIKNRAEQAKHEITNWRRELHQHPQTSYEETYISGVVAEKLEQFGIKTERGWAGTGVVGIIEGKQKSDKCIALRADIDALDITEENSFDYVSKYPGKMHACGHDGHTAMLLGAAKLLSEENNFQGKVMLIFQPAEEGGGGAKVMIDEGLFTKHNPESVWGMHNWPGLPVGQFAMRDGAFLASTNDFTIHVNGKGGHAAVPQYCKDPIVAASHIVAAAQSIVSREMNPNNPSLISITTFNAGTAFNIIPDQAKLTGTIRALDDQVQSELVNSLKRIVAGAEEMFGLQIEFNLLESAYPTLYNNVQETQFSYELCSQLTSSENVTRQYEPTLGGEDFAFMLQKRPGCFLLIGNQAAEKGNNMLHTSKYDFNDDIIPLGVTYWTALAESKLS